MRAILKIAFFSLLVSSAFAQVNEVTVGDTAAPTRNTRARWEFDANGRPGIKVGTGSWVRLPLYSELQAAAGGGVQTVNNITPTSGNVNITFANLLSKPTTISGFGISDGVSTGGSYTNPSWLVSIPFSKLSSLPTTLSGHGITDGVSTGSTYSNPSWLTAYAWSKLTGTPTTLAGYGITDGATSSALNLKADAATSIPYTPVTNYSGLTSVSLPAANTIKFAVVQTDERYTDTYTLYVINPSGKIKKVAFIAEN